MDVDDKLDIIFGQVRREFHRATDIFGAFNSPHEGCAIIREEFEELWDCAKNNEPAICHHKEAIQVAAMGIRYIFDITFDVTYASDDDHGGE